MQSILKLIVFIILVTMTITGYSQKGTGEMVGVSRKELNPKILKFNGSIEEIETGPCKYTTGKSVSGTHLKVKTEQGVLNIHLGPTTEISQLFDPIKGDEVSLNVFRTDKLPENHYIAKDVLIDQKNTILRDDNLKPVWAGQNRKRLSRR